MFRKTRRPQKHEKQARNQAILKLYPQYTQEELGIFFNISRQRVSRIIKRGRLQVLQQVLRQMEWEGKDTVTR